MGVLPRVVATLAAAAIGHVAILETTSRAAVVVDDLLVRVYDTVGVPAAVRTRALARAGDILARAELGVAWLACPSGGAWTLSACSAPPAAGEMIVRFARTSSEARRAYPHALGYSLIDADTGVGMLATIFTDRVDLMARGARSESAAVLGRAIAHELGHLMLGTRHHSATGLMRERWTLEEFVRDHPKDWQFTETERDAMHASLHARAVAPAATGGGGPNPHVLLNKTP